MRAGLPKKEPEIQAAWDDMNFFEELRARCQGRKVYPS